ncbi:MAG TPA: M48 family metalloprotease [Gemmatimonadales bacterium]|nr:M48 family metalloprotease [Gemmatimonadales bacterium]
MTSEQFDALVRHVEGYAQANRRAYRLRVGALALAGYAYVWLVLLVCIGALAVLVWLAATTTGGKTAIGKLGIAIVVLAYAIARALWVRFEPPVGVPISRQDAPQLFALLDQLRDALRTPRFHRVLVTDDFNAAVSQEPRLGPLGWYQNYLLLGLPLMHALSPDEFKAVLAHELGHISREHGRFGAWIYRIRMAWVRIVEQLETSKHWGYQLFDWFLKRWAPYFNAYSFVMAREQEYEADRYAALIAGTDPMARALVALEIQGARLAERFWPSVFQTAARQPEPPSDVLTSLRDSLHRPPEHEDGRRWFTAALNRATGSDDTHPSLSARLKALGVSPPADAAVRGAPERTAADHYMGEGLVRLSARVETLWRHAVEHGWRQKHQAHVRGEARLRELDARAATEPLALRDAWERAELVLQLRGQEAALEPLRQVLALDVDHAAANYALGDILLDSQDEAGVAHIERAVTRDPSARAQGYHLICAFYEGMGRTEQADVYRRRAWEESDLLEVADKERRDVNGKDTLLPHELPEAKLAPVREALGKFEDVTEAHLVRKAVTHMPERPFYVLGVKMRLPWYRYRSESKEQRLVERLAHEVPVPGQCLVVALNDHTAKIRKNMKRVPGSQLR